MKVKGKEEGTFAEGDAANVRARVDEAIATLGGRRGRTVAHAGVAEGGAGMGGKVDAVTVGGTVHLDVGKRRGEEGGEERGEEKEEARAWSLVPEALIRPRRKMECQFSMALPWKAKVLPCLALRARNFSSFSGGAERSRY